MNAYKYKFKTKINLVTKFVYDLFCFVISSYLAFFIRFDFSFDVLVNYLDYLKIASVIELILGFMIIHIYKTYKDIWQYTSINEIFKLIKATILEKLIFSIIILSLSLEGFPRSIFLISPITAFTLLVVPRLFIRLSREERNGGKKGENNTLIVGAGDAGEKIIREIKAHSHLGYNVVGFVDDNPAKYGCYLQGVKVLGDTYSIPNLVSELSIKSILIAIPTAKREEIKRIYDSISGLPVKLLILPGIYEIIGGNVTISHLRPFGLSDLLFREQVKLITEKSIKKYNGTKVLVTGACGSIGSEICRSLVDLGAKVIAYDNNETGIFDLEKELSNSIVPIVGDIRFKEKLKAVLDEYKPSVVFHAAAYKHVPLMEILPEEAVINNIIGTLNVVEACAESKISQCVIISTDKAVEPKNIMGMTKRISELIIIALNNKTNTKLSAVRFGNVLGSRGNVLEIWKKEYERGHPLSITDPNMKRYFMLTSEAAALSIEASTLSNGGDILILDMGKEVRMTDLAEAFCKIQNTSLKAVGTKIIGIRPGEKLEEKLYSKNEQIVRTDHEKIFRINNNLNLKWEDLKEQIEELKILANNGDRESLIKTLSTLSKL